MNEKKYTNLDRVREMSAGELYDTIGHPDCPPWEGTKECIYPGCRACWIAWLKSETKVKPDLCAKLKNCAGTLAEILELLVNGEDIPDTIIACAQDEVDDAVDTLKKVRGEECGSRSMVCR